MQAVTDVLIDTSRSMADHWVGGQTRAQVVSQLLADVVMPTLGQGSLVGLRAFGGVCEVWTITEPIPYAPETFQSFLDKIPRPKGNTPLCEAVEISLNALERMPQGQRQIVLLSDGRESCGGNLQRLLQRLKLTGQSPSALLRVYTVGVGAQASAFNDLQQIAEVTGGTFVQISQPSDADAVRAEFEKVARTVVQDRPISSDEDSNDKAPDRAHPTAGKQQAASNPVASHANRSAQNGAFFLQVAVFLLCCYIAYVVTAHWNWARGTLEENQSGTSKEAALTDNVRLHADFAAVRKELEDMKERLDMQTGVIDALTHELSNRQEVGGR